MSKQNPNSDAFASRLQALRQERNLSIRDLAERAELWYSRLAELENPDGRGPLLWEIISLARGLSIEPGDLLGGADRALFTFDWSAIAGAYQDGYESRIDASAEHPAGRGDDLRVAPLSGAMLATLEVMDQLIRYFGGDERGRDRAVWLRLLRDDLQEGIGR